MYLTKFKRFVSAEIDLDRSLTVLMGKNNSGKSTILDALRIVFGGEFAPNEVYLNKKFGRTGTAEIVIHCRLTSQEWESAIRIQNDPYSFSIETIAAQMQSDLVVIGRKVTYINGAVTNSERYGRLLVDNDLAKVADSKAHQIIRHALNTFANQNLFEATGIMFLNAERTFQKTEDFLSFRKLRGLRNRNEYIRNNLYFLQETRKPEYDTIVGRITQIFPDAEQVETMLNKETGQIDITFKEGGFDSDIGEMGSGTRSLVMIVARILAPTTTVALLDEPDINMHSALVRQLVRLFEELAKEVQIVMTSHHAEFVNNVDKSNLLHVKLKDKLESSISLLSEKNQVSDLLLDLGILPTNLEEADVRAGKIVVLGEGKTDWKYFLLFAQRLGREAELETIRPTYFPVGGSITIEARLIDKIDEDTKLFLIRDRDEHDKHYIEQVESKFGKDRVHFLKKREIENYILDYKTLLKLLKTKAQSKSQDIATKLESLTEESVVQKITSLSQDLKMKVTLLRLLEVIPPLGNLKRDELGAWVDRNVGRAISEKATIVDDLRGKILDKLAVKSGQELGDMLQKEFNDVSAIWTPEGILTYCPGKDLLHAINKWTNVEYGLTISVPDLIEVIDNIDPEINEIITKIVTLSRK